MVGESKLFANTEDSVYVSVTDHCRNLGNWILFYLNQCCKNYSCCNVIISAVFARVYIIKFTATLYAISHWLKNVRQQKKAEMVKVFYVGTRCNSWSPRKQRHTRTHTYRPS